MNLKKFDTFLFDLDETLWRVSKLLPGAKELLKRLRRLNKEIYFVTNNNLMSREDTANRLNRLGIKTRKEEVINSGYVASVYFKKKDASVMVFGKGLEKELRSNGIKVKRKLPVDYVLMGDDLTFNFFKITLAMHALEKGAKFVTCNMGKRWHIGNRAVPGVGSLTSSIIYATGIQPLILGKPNKPMLDVVKKVVKNPRKTVMIGNDAVDVLLAEKLRCSSVWISEKNSRDINPTFRLKSVKELLKFI